MNRTVAVRAVAALSACVALLVSATGVYAFTDVEDEPIFTGCLGIRSGRLTKVAIGPDPIRPCTSKQAEITWDRAGPALEERLSELEARVAALEQRPQPIPIASLLAEGRAEIVASPSDIGSTNDVFDRDLGTEYRSAAVNPAVLQLTFADPVTITETALYPTSGLIDPAYAWKVEVADNAEDLANQTGSYRLVVPRAEALTDTWSRQVLPEPVSASVVQLTVERLTTDDFVHIAEWELLGPDHE